MSFVRIESKNQSYWQWYQGSHPSNSNTLLGYQIIKWQTKNKYY